MIRNNIYYRLKPLIPWTTRLALRRWFAWHKRKKVSGIWPIMHGSERAPAGWPGWPEGKQFAVVLTHDIESQMGLDKCRQLMELEISLGFRSSFNLIPEGEYRVPSELRQELTRNGFEVGVHDLYHDGKLYRGRQEFANKARRINHYLKEWGAVGFRSGFMLHNLEWLGDLEVLYDASTFDTDPFEPQPEGVGTIFPFWVPRVNARGLRNSDQEGSQGNGKPSHGGYVELPYTLAQDSTLFVVLGERHPDIWIQKLEWIARHGGMALLGAHPDYMDFGGSARGVAYPAGLYRSFLEHVRTKYAGQYWQPTPRALAEWYQATRRKSSPIGETVDTGQEDLRGKRAAVVLYSYYPADARPRREAEALAKAGMEVDLICLRQGGEEASTETINGVRVRRFPLRRRRDSKLTYIVQYGSFIAASAATLAWRSLWKRYELVHVHNMPDILVFSGLIPKLRGARVLLDLHDPMPELMMSIFRLSEKTFGVRLLKWLEKLSIGFADQVLTVNLACKRIFISRSCSPAKILVVMNSPDEGIFGFRACEEVVHRRDGDPFVIMYHGSIVERHGLDLAVQALGSVKRTIPAAELRIYGQRTAFLESVLDSVRKNGLLDSVHYLGPKNHEQIVAAIEQCDVGIIPNRRSLFTEINTPTRIFEYLSRGKPAVAPLVPGITDYFDGENLLYFRLGDAEDLAKKIEYVYEHPQEVRETVKRGQGVYLKHTWSQEKSRFVARVRALLAPSGTGPNHQKNPPVSEFKDAN